MHKVLQSINGKVLLFTDQHLGLKGNSESRIKIVVQVFKEVIQYAKKNGIKHVISLGDIFHSRTAIDVNVINVAYKLVSALAKNCNVILLAGNHDIYLKNSADVNSINIFQDIPNVTLLDQTAEISINSNRCALVPWLGDISQFENKSVNCAFGHFDISAKFLMQMYKDNNRNTSEASSSLSAELGTPIQNSSEDLGNFVDIVKENGIIFSGHIHTRKESIVKGRNLIFIGAPYQQTLGDVGCKCGFYVLNENMTYEFHEISTTPKHIHLKMSQITKDIDSFDFSVAKNNIIHKIYDVEVDRITDTKISQKIADMHPFEELLPDYEVKSQHVKDQVADENIELLKKSKLEYISNYIDKIDSEALMGENIDKKRLFDILQRYYNEVI